MKYIKLLGIFLLAMSVLTGCEEAGKVQEAMETYTYMESESLHTLENEQLKIQLDPTTTYFQITNKASGYTWYSNPIECAKDELADSESLNLLQSTLAIEYSTPNGVNTIYNNFAYSIEKGIYEIEQGTDYIKVNYSIGNTEKIFVIPPAATESRMQEFLDKMDSKGQKQIKEYYRKYDINKLRTSDNKSELLKQYPDLANECVYALRDGLQDHIRQKLEGVFEGAGYTVEDLEADKARYEGGSSSEKPLFNISVIYRLEGNDLVVELPMEEMSWKSNYPLTKIKVLPYFGAGGVNDEGFILVPEGTGGIINFNNGKSAQSAYYADVYGWDYGMKRNALIDESRSSYPVFGIANGSESMLCFLEDQSAIATIEADISGRNHSYNFANATYRMVHGESMDVSAKSDKTVMVFEEGKPTGSIKQRYRFLDTTSYGEMASTYREYLIEKYPSLMKKTEEGVPVSIEILGAVDRVKQRFGFPMSVAEPLTTYKEARSMLEDLNARGYSNLYVKYSGWMNGGITHSPLTNIKTVPALGSSKDLKDFIAYSNEINIPVYLAGNVQNAYNNKTFDGFVINRDAAKHVTREVVKLRDFSSVWYGEEDWRDPYYLLNPKMQVKSMMNLAQAADKYDAQGVAFIDAGYELGADYNPKKLTTRDEVTKLQEGALQELKANNQGIMLSKGNVYMLPYADYVTDMDLSGKNFMIIDYAVPFYTMAIHGIVNYSGTAINLSSDYTQMVLKSIEEGAGLYFNFMLESTSTLQETNYTKYFGGDYNEWCKKADEIYSRYNEEVGHTFNQYMVLHEKLAEGVFVTGYEDGTKVYVNYNDTDYVKGSLRVPAQDYKVERG